MEASKGELFWLVASLHFLSESHWMNTLCSHSTTRPFNHCSLLGHENLKFLSTYAFSENLDLNVDGLNYVY